MATQAAAAPVTSSAIGPITAQERIAELDILRGFALFGILIVNMAFFRFTVYSFFVRDLDPWTGRADHVVKWLIGFFAEGKFNSLFSFLFGLGLIIQLSRADARGASFVPLYIRRLLVLIVLGLMHAYLIWLGDVLLFYGVLGFVLLLFRRRSNKVLFAGAAVFLLLPIAMEAGRLARAGKPEPMPDFRKIHQVALQAYSQGSYMDVAQVRASEVNFFYFSPFALTFSCDLMVTLLLGLYVGRRGVFQDIPSHLPWVRKVMWRALALGLVFNAGKVIFGEFSNPLAPSLANVGTAVCHTLGRPTLFSFYAAGLLVLTQQGNWKRRLAPLGFIGRMPLTNYLMQSVICTLLFNGYGFGLFAKVGWAGGLALTVLIFLAQIPLSQWWMGEFRFGPMEWLWRTITYGKVQPMRMEGAIPVTAYAQSSLSGP